MSRRLREPYRIRQRCFRHAVNAMIKTIVEDAYALGISKIVVGDLKGKETITITRKQML